MTEDEIRLFDDWVKVADSSPDRRFTIVKSSTEWRVSFTIPDERDESNVVGQGKTFEMAASRAMVRLWRSGRD